MPASLLCRAAAACLLVTLASCGPLGTPAPTQTAAPTPTPLPPSATPEPLAASVNGEPVLLSEFESEVLRYEAAQRNLGIELATSPSDRSLVLQSIIDLELLAQEAVAQGYTVTEEELSAALDQLADEVGGGEAVGAWLAANQYDIVSFRRTLRREQLAQRTVERIANQVPAEMEQVHARHILVESQAEAESLRAQWEDGADFAELAVQHSLDTSTRVGGGDLGWFPAGLLQYEALGQAAFSLEPGQVSPVIETELGFHLVQTVERATRPLSPNDQRRLRQQAVEEWLADRRANAESEILIEP